MDAGAPRPPPKSSGARGRFVAVQGARQQDPVDPQDLRAARRRAIQKKLDEVAVQAASVQLPLLGGLLLLQVMLAVVLTGLGEGRIWLGQRAVWAVPAVLLATVLLVAPRRAKALADRWLPLVLVTAVVAAAGPWLIEPDLRPVMLAWTTVMGVAGAIAVAALPVSASLLALVPLVSSASVQAPESWVWWLVGALGSLVAAAAAGLRFRGWRRNVRSLVEHEERLRLVEQERDEALRTDQEKSRFLAVASHDLRQPVHALGLFAATLQRRLQQSPDEPLARNLMRAVDGLERSFNALLDISKLDAGSVMPRVETFALRDMFRRLHMQYAGQAELAGLGLRFSPGGKSVSSDPQLLERICSNLIQNAIKYTTQGGIVVVARSTHQCVNIEVWDTGSGILAQDLPRIFDEFYQVERGERDRSHGLGMGLAIVKRLTALLNHRLEVASVPGRGTLFRISVPRGGLCGIADDLAAADTQPMQLQATRMVLVIDDEEPIREGLRLLLQEWGFQVMTAANAAQTEQVVMALEGRVDLVLSDLHLGDGPDGTEIIAEVRRLCGRDVPAILITGDTGHERIDSVATTDPILFKPVQARRLYEALRATLI